MTSTFPRRILYLATFVLYLLHNDLWFWDDPQMVLGIPVGLFYHLAYCVAAAIMMALLVTYAWPDHLSLPDERDSEL